jgi:hypothetical protein
MKTFFRFTWGVLLGLVLAMALAVLAAHVLKSDETGGLILLLGWPLLAWLLLRKPSTAAAGQSSLLRRSTWILVALPIVVAIPLFAFLGSLKGEGAAVVVLLFVALLLIGTAVSWGAALITYFAGRRRKKPKAPAA